MADDPNVPDQWQLDSGLRDNMTFTVHGGYFMPHAEYQEGKQLLLWLQGTDEENEPYELRMSIGSDWQSPDGGTTIVHPTKKAQHINESSIYGHWIANALAVPELKRELLSRPGGPTDSRIWVGLILQLNLVKISWGPTIPDQERLMPTALVGLTDASGNATMPPMAAPAPPVMTAPAPVAAPPAPVDQVFDPQAALAAARAAAPAPQVAANANPLFQRAVQLAAQAPDYATFLGAAFADAEILADDELAQQCANDGAGGVWAIAHPA